MLVIVLPDRGLFLQINEHVARIVVALVKPSVSGCTFFAGKSADELAVLQVPDVQMKSSRTMAKRVPLRSKAPPSNSLRRAGRQGQPAGHRKVRGVEDFNGVLRGTATYLRWALSGDRLHSSTRWIAVFGGRGSCHSSRVLEYWPWVRSRFVPTNRPQANWVEK